MTRASEFFLAMGPVGWGVPRAQMQVKTALISIAAIRPP